MKMSLLVAALSIVVRAAAPVTTLANFPNSMVYAVQTDAAGNMPRASRGILRRLTPSSPN